MDIENTGKMETTEIPYLFLRDEHASMVCSALVERDFSLGVVFLRAASPCAEGQELSRPFLKSNILGKPGCA